jgi:hypothetical protein
VSGHEVVQHLDIQEFARGHDLARGRHVLGRGRAVATDERTSVMRPRRPARAQSPQKCFLGGLGLGWAATWGTTSPSAMAGRVGICQWR